MALSKMPRLRVLGVSCRKVDDAITDRSLEILGRMLTLESIELYETKDVTDAGLVYVAGLPRLRDVHLSGLPNVTIAGTRVFPAHVLVDYNV